MLTLITEDSLLTKKLVRTVSSSCSVEAYTQKLFITFGKLHVVSVVTVNGCAVEDVILQYKNAPITWLHLPLLFYTYEKPMSFSERSEYARNAIWSSLGRHSFLLLLNYVCSCIHTQCGDSICTCCVRGSGLASF